MEEAPLYESMINGFKELLSYIDWVYFFIFIISAWGVLAFFKGDSVAKTFHLVGKKIWYVFITGCVVGCLYAWAMDINDKVGIFKLVLTLIVAIVTVKITGLNKLMYKLFKIPFKQE